MALNSFKLPTLSPDAHARRRRYILTSIAANAGLWVIALVILFAWPRSYTSEWTLILPSGDNDARVSLNDVGQAMTTPRSSYDSKSLDPRVNYKSIMLSDTVLNAAASAIQLKPAQFGEPRLKLIDQSSVMELSISGRSPEEARAKSRALYRTFQQRLDQLRADETEQRDKGIENAIKTTRSKLDTAQHRLTEFKVNSSIVSQNQLEDIAQGNTQLEKKRLELMSKLASARMNLASLSGSMGIDATTAGLIIAMQSDSLFLDYYKQYTEAEALLSDAQYKWGAAHHKVIEGQQQSAAAFGSLLKRARELAGPNITARTLKRLNLHLGAQGREPLLRDIVATKAMIDSSQGELSEVERQLMAQREEMMRLARETSQLEDLERRLKFSEAIFSSTLGKTDMGGSNLYSSYPLVQVLLEPTLPSRPSSPNRMATLFGALAGSLFMTTGLTLAWLRKKKGDERAAAVL